ncbi:MAG: guanylate kinase [Alphaproteobacteria bacterium]|nr:guanylate kinase [Alphaproteobacteria bacterium]
MNNGLDIINHFRKVRRGAMFIIEAPSGTGKTSVIKELLKADANLKFSVSVTTRAPRAGEQNGVDYFFISDEQYNEHMKNDDFYEYVDSQYGSRYGTLRSEVDSFISVGQDVIFDMDWVGLRQMKEKAKDDVVSIYLLPPSIKELRRRLVDRNDDINIINQRMGVIREKMSHWNEYDYVVINADLNQTIETVKEIISAERMKRVRQTGLIEFVKQLDEEAKNME